MNDRIRQEKDEETNRITEMIFANVKLYVEQV